MAFTRIASAFKQSSSLNADVTTDPADFTGCDLIVIAAVSFSTTTSPTDNQGNNYNDLIYNAGDFGYGDIFAIISYLENPTTSSVQTFTAYSKAACIWVGGYTGFYISSAPSAGSGVNNNRASASLTLSTLSPAFTNELIVGVVGTEGTDSPPFTGLSGGPTFLQNVPGALATVFGIGVMEWIQTSPATSTPTVTFSTSSNLAWGFQASFLAADSGVGRASYLPLLGVS